MLQILMKIDYAREREIMCSNAPILRIGVKEDLIFVPIVWLLSFYLLNGDMTINGWGVQPAQ